jgi:hypothetical protein
MRECYAKSGTRLRGAGLRMDGPMPCAVRQSSAIRTWWLRWPRAPSRASGFGCTAAPWSGAGCERIFVVTIGVRAPSPVEPLPGDGIVGCVAAPRQ